MTEDERFRKAMAESKSSIEKITPSGFIYEAPTTYEELRQRHTTAAQAFIESWDESEHPPEPTWESVGLAHRRVQQLQALLTRRTHGPASTRPARRPG